MSITSCRRASFRSPESTESLRLCIVGRDLSVWKKKWLLLIGIEKPEGVERSDPVRELVAQPAELIEPVEPVGVESPPIQVKIAEPEKAKVTQTPNEMATPMDKHVYGLLLLLVCGVWIPYVILSYLKLNIHLHDIFSGNSSRSGIQKMICDNFLKTTTTTTTGKTTFGETIINLPEGLYQIKERWPFNTTDLFTNNVTYEEQELAYYKINNEWSFDEAVVEKYGCIVRAFDPTMSNYPNVTKRGEKIFFYPVGIYGNNTVIKLKRHKICPVKTLGTIRKELHDEEKVIDYLKSDVERFEWSALEAMFSEGFLSKYVKQIGIEYHNHYIKKHQNEPVPLGAMLTKGAVPDNLPPVARALALHEFKMASHVKTRSNTSCYK
ncbi:hypothetical protein LSH36_82g03052 [Paralvinella palmiformis]|uniref:Methyltransferase domain-containing protein n=1 Tax=Paralvinella palmiformis TaxID=53620 RepID=A0AAD9K3K8_9ANNE|nr:hypothetical protein LSH36_82g03052 [Paralvinella palmiformis]